MARKDNLRIIWERVQEKSYCARELLMARCIVQLGTTTEEAIGLINATLGSNLTVVEAVSMRDVVKAGSVEKALSHGVIQLGFEDEIQDGFLLLLTPGRLPEAMGRMYFRQCF